ncbi:DUF4259 domain-containing protein, partial [Streptomyces sp. NPDC012438]|uniref:DUF4259 domain-containing protein n=1 Tax=Streptomyces sp. NPDC012438 TaxID=3364833 RepID=UPI0036E128D4
QAQDHPTPAPLCCHPTRLPSPYTELILKRSVITAQCPGGEPISTSYGPDETLPIIADDLQPLAVEALDRVVAEASELAELWDETPDGPRWRQNIRGLHAVLALEPEPQEDLLFDL